MRNEKADRASQAAARSDCDNRKQAALLSAFPRLTVSHASSCPPTLQLFFHYPHTPTEIFNLGLYLLRERGGDQLKAKSLLETDLAQRFQMSHSETLGKSFFTYSRLPSHQSARLNFMLNIFVLGQVLGLGFPLLSVALGHRR